MTPTDEKSALPETPAERMAGGASVRKASGEPIAAQGRTIIPVARVAMGFKGGFRGGPRGLLRLGNAPAGPPPPPAGEGPSHGGVTRRLVVRPVGFIDVSGTDSRAASFPSPPAGSWPWASRWPSRWARSSAGAGPAGR